MKTLRILGEDLKVKISPSFLQNAQCPAYLRFNYIDRPDEKYIRLAAERGSAIHEALADLLRECIEEGIQPSDLDDKSIRDAVEKHIPHYLMSEIPLVLEWAREWRNKFEIPSFSHLGVEEKIGLDDEFDMCDFHDASYRGVLDFYRIDWKNKRVVITDWKSQPNILSSEDLDRHFQLTFYAWLLWKLHPELNHFECRIWYLRYGFYAETVRTEDDLIAFEDELYLRERTILKIDSWDPIPGKQCQYCDYIRHCPIASDLSPTQPNVISQEQAILAAQRLTVMEHLSKDIKAKLKTYVDNNDDVRLGDNYVVGYKHVESSRWNPRKVADVLLGFDRNPGDYMSTSVTEMKKIIKQAKREDPEFARALDDVKEVKHSTRFEGYEKPVR